VDRQGVMIILLVAIGGAVLSTRTTTLSAELETERDGEEGQQTWRGQWALPCNEDAVVQEGCLQVVEACDMQGTKRCLASSVGYFLERGLIHSCKDQHCPVGTYYNLFECAGFDSGCVECVVQVGCSESYAQCSNTVGHQKELACAVPAEGYYIQDDIAKTTMLTESESGGDGPSPSKHKAAVVVSTTLAAILFLAVTVLVADRMNKKRRLEEGGEATAKPLADGAAPKYVPNAAYVGAASNFKKSPVYEGDGYGIPTPQFVAAGTATIPAASKAPSLMQSHALSHPVQQLQQQLQQLQQQQQQQQQLHQATTSQAAAQAAQMMVDVQAQAAQVQAAQAQLAQDFTRAAAMKAQAAMQIMPGLQQHFNSYMHQPQQLAASMVSTSMASAAAGATMKQKEGAVQLQRAMQAQFELGLPGSVSGLFGYGAAGAAHAAAAAAVSAAATLGFTGGGSSPILFSPPSPEEYLAASSPLSESAKLTSSAKVKGPASKHAEKQWMCNPNKPKSGRCSTGSRKHSCTNEGCLRRCCLITKDSGAKTAEGDGSTSVSLDDGTWFQCKHPQCLAKGLVVGNANSRSKKSGPGANVGNTTCFHSVKTLQTHIKTRHQEMYSSLSTCTHCEEMATVTLQYCEVCAAQVLSSSACRTKLPQTTIADAVAMHRMQQQQQQQQQPHHRHQYHHRHHHHQHPTAGTQSNHLQHSHRLQTSPKRAAPSKVAMRATAATAAAAASSLSAATADASETAAAVAAAILSAGANAHGTSPGAGAAVATANIRLPLAHTTPGNASAC